MKEKTPKDIFKEMVNLCYEEDYPELHQEIIFLEAETKKKKETYKYEKAMEELLNIIPIFANDFHQEIYSQIEDLYRDFLDNLE